MITTFDLAWASGFLEGEGCFQFHINGSGGSTPRVSASQVQRVPLDRLKTLFGGSIRWRPTRGSGIHEWEFCGPSAMGLMLTLYPLLSPRRQDQVRRAVTVWKARPGKGIHNRNKTHCPQGHPYDGSNTIARKGGRLRICRTCNQDFWERNGKKYAERQRLRKAAVKMLSA